MVVWPSKVVIFDIQNSPGRDVITHEARDTAAA